MFNLKGPWALGFNSRVRGIAFDVRPRARTSQTCTSSPVGRPTRQGDPRGDRISTKVTLNTHAIRYVLIVEKQITKYTSIFLTKLKTNQWNTSKCCHTSLAENNTKAALPGIELEIRHKNSVSSRLASHELNLQNYNIE